MMMLTLRLSLRLVLATLLIVFMPESLRPVEFTPSMRQMETK